LENITMKPMLGVTAALMTAITLLPVHAAEVSSVAGENDWPQYSGPNRDNVAVKSPKLLDAWPKEGPPLAWKSDWIPGWVQGGCGGPAVADGKVFVYATAKNPVGGASVYKVITPEVLENAGWLPDLPADLAKKIEDTRVSTGRPATPGWPWWEIKDPKVKEKELEDFLAKKPELEKYIKDFIATLKPEEAGKYGTYIKKRLCMAPHGQGGWQPSDGVTWDGLEKLSKLQGSEFPTLREWGRQVNKASPGRRTLSDHLAIDRFLDVAWGHCFTRSDTLVCLDATTGKTLWKKDFPVDDTQVKTFGGWPSTYMGLSGTPTISDGKCYFGGAMGLYCLSTKDGALLWQVKGLQQSHNSVLVENGVVYYCGAAYDGGTGRLLWKTPLWNKNPHEWHSNVPSLLWKSGGKTYVIAGNGEGSLGKGGLFSCLDLETGKELWKLKVRHSDCSLCYPVLHGDILMAEGKSYRMTPTELQPLASLAKVGTVFCSGAMVQDYYYALAPGGEGSTGIEVTGVGCWDFKTGDLKWNGPDTFSPWTPIIHADGKIFVAKGTGGGQEDWIWTDCEVLMVKATPEKYVPLGTFAPRMNWWTPMAFSDGKLLVRTEVGISCYDLVQHGLYFDKTVVAQDKVTFAFKQTGGGLAAKDAASGIVITDAKGATKPAKATIDGDTIVVDIKDVPVPFGVSCGEKNAFAGKNGQPVPAFEWNEARVLKFRTCFDQTIVLKSDLLLPQNGTWDSGATYLVTGATVTKAKVNSLDKTVILTTDKTWKSGDAVTLTYPRFHVDQGEPLRETLTFTARGGSAATFVKMDETTSGSWKGVYGAQGAVIAGDATAVSKCAVVTVKTLNPGATPWAVVGSTNDTRAVQKSGEAKDRVAACWTVAHPAAYYQIDIEFTDEKEHQVALYCLDWDKAGGGGRSMTVEVWDPWRNVVLADKQTIKEFSNGKYLIWNLKGHVALHLQGSNWYNAVASGVFFDAPAQTGK
jgi:outer membrane protein assembly factor BamB